jgi:hypothetical protein
MLNALSILMIVVVLVNVASNIGVITFLGSFNSFWYVHASADNILFSCQILLNSLGFLRR